MARTNPEFVGQGVARTLPRPSSILAHNWLNVRRLGLIVFEDNPRAIRLYERLGFEHEGVMREFGSKRGGYVDAVVMGAYTADDYREIRQPTMPAPSPPGRSMRCGLVGAL